MLGVRGIALGSAVLTGALLTGSAYAQSNTEGSISGVVKPQPGQSIIAKSVDTGLTREVRPDSNGRFLITSLPTGRYDVTLKESGAPDLSTQVLVSVGSASGVRFDQFIENVTVTGTRTREVLVDTTTSESALNLSSEQIAELPVARNLTQIALLAPGVVEGDTAFGSEGFGGTLASFGGATVGENAYYINGFNVTNFRNGLGGSTVPFQAYQDFQIKTGGYGAEFGRSTGGVINSTTRRGTNKWTFGFSSFFEPDSLSAHSRDVRDAETGAVIVSNRNDSGDTLEINTEIGGPIIQDRLFVYGLYSLRDRETENGLLGSFDRQKRDDPFYLIKVDANITDDQRLEFTTFSDKDDIVSTSFRYDANTNVRGDRIGTTLFKRGGENIIARYTGNFTDNFSVSALYGNGKYNRSNVGEGDACPRVTDATSGTGVLIGCSTTAQPSSLEDEREAYRIDAQLTLGAHQLRAGYDREDNSSFNSVNFSGGAAFIYRTVGAGGIANQIPGFTPGTQFVQKRIFQSTGEFQVLSSAYYLEDNWQVTDGLILNLGLRNETFDNRNALGSTFVKIDDQIAPRLGFSWDVKADGRSKLFGSYGRYYLPVASNTNVRLAGAELFFDEFFLVNGDRDPVTGAPLTLGTQIGPRRNFADGTVKDVRSIVNQNLDPMYQDEFRVGFQQQLSQNWAATLGFTYRDLKSSLEDVSVDGALLDFARANGFNDFTAGGFDFYVLTNPGNDINMSVDLDGDGTLETITLNGDAIGYPEAKRRYVAMDLEFRRAFADKWALQGSYTWSHSYGNSEGYVRSDNGQTDAGLTTAFDTPGLTDGSSGNLPNDRRHSFKLFGLYQVLPDVAVSANFRATSGRPKNCFGVHPTEEFAAAYGNESFYCAGELQPRGSRGRLPWQYKLDLGVEYRPSFLESFSLKLDVFNLFNSQHVTEVIETGERGEIGSVNQNFGRPSSFQQPRTVRVSANYNFGL
jgi:hypothetical protein